MKLKYYLRGLGVGILFAAIVMTVSSNIHKNNLSDEEIIKAAKELGMIMPEDTEKKNGLFEKKEDTEASTDSQIPENTQTMPDIPLSEEVQVSPDSQIPEDTQVAVDIPFPEVSQTPIEPQDPVDVLPATESEDLVYVKITINAQDTATKVGKTLYKNGLIDSAEDFCAYLKEHRYTTVIRAGVFEIPMGATYEEICAIIINLDWFERHMQ